MDVRIGIWQILVLICIAVLALAPVIAIIDITKGKFKAPNDRLIWILVVLFLNPLGALLYFLMGKDQKVKEDGNGNLHQDTSLKQDL